MPKYYELTARIGTLNVGIMERNKGNWTWTGQIRLINIHMANDSDAHYSRFIKLGLFIIICFPLISG